MTDIGSIAYEAHQNATVTRGDAVAGHIPPPWSELDAAARKPWREAAIASCNYVAVQYEGSVRELREAVTALSERVKRAEGERDKARTHSAGTLLRYGPALRDLRALLREVLDSFDPDSGISRVGPLKVTQWSVQAATAGHAAPAASVTGYGPEADALRADVDGEEERQTVAILALHAERDRMERERDEARAERDRLKDERDGAHELVRRLERITTAWTRGMYSARIDCWRGDARAAAATLSEGLDGFDGAPWNEAETGTEWWERTKAEEGL